MKKVLITGSGSYIGEHIKRWLEKHQKALVYTLDVRNPDWKTYDFSLYDTVINVAGIAHIKETKENAHLYYEINRDLAFEIAKKSKEEGIKQFVLLSSMSVYGMTTGIISKDTIPAPKNHYGKSKLQADELILNLETENFKVAVIRPPMVYGKNCKGNYRILRKFALKSPVFPNIQNHRSMIFIDNLTAFIASIVLDTKRGIYFPQDKEYVTTSYMVQKIAENHGKKIKLVNIFNSFIKIGLKLHISVIEKVFGDLVYEKMDKISVKSFDEIMKKIENK